MLAPWQPLLDWWFGEEDSAPRIAAQKHGLWFGYRDEQDAEARHRFGDLTRRALDGELDDWVRSPDGWVALVLLLDQLPRMLFRGTSRAFAGDEHARQLVREGLVQGGDMLVPPIRRVFLYLVLEHAEDLGLQEQAVGYFTQLRDIALPEERELFEDFLAFARRHRDVIAQFGRFPHRNAILGRESSEAEEAFLARPGSRF